MDLRSAGLTKKIFPILVLFPLLLSLSSCGDPYLEEGTSSNSDSSDSEPYEVPVSRLSDTGTKAFYLEIPGGQYVLCARTTTSEGVGISCDWYNKRKIRDN